MSLDFMRDELVAWVAMCGVVSRSQARTRFPLHVIDDALAAGALIRLLPGIYSCGGAEVGIDLMRRGALLYRQDAALSHVDALDEWGLPASGVAGGPIHLVTDERHRESNVKEVVVHRRNGFRLGPPQSVMRNGLRLVRLEAAIVDSWPMLAALDRRAPALIAVRDRRTTAQRLLDALSERGRIQGASEMRKLFGLIAVGCHSPLELWGHERIFSVGALRDARPQFRVSTGGRTVYLDRYLEHEMLAVELDGAAYHGTPGQRERDIRRDAWLATLGIQTIRFAHPRLFGDPEGVRQEILAIRAVRRAQLSSRPA